MGVLRSDEACGLDVLDKEVAKGDVLRAFVVGEEVDG